MSSNSENAEVPGMAPPSLADLAARGSRPRPVESWDPPYLGDIGLRIEADGRWLYQGSPIARESLVRLFASILRKDADGRTYLVTPAEKYAVAVADAAFLAVEMAVSGSGREQTLTFRTSVDDVVACDGDYPLRFSPDPRTGAPKPYVRVRGRLEALLTRACYLELVDLATVEEIDGARKLGVWSGGSFFPMAPACDIEGGP